MRMSKSSIRKSVVLLVMALLVLLVFAGPALAQQGSGTAWHASYWNNKEFSGHPAVQTVEHQAPDYGWGHGSPYPGVNDDDFSARWIADQYFNTPGRYRFSIRTDDGARLWVNDQRIIDEWHPATGETYTADVDIPKAGPVSIRLDFYEDKGNAGIHLAWERVGEIAEVKPIRAEYFNNMTLSGAPVMVRNEGPGLYHNWGTGSPGSVNPDHFSARYTQTMSLTPGKYQFKFQADDGIRFYVNNKLVVDRWSDSISNEPLYVTMDLQGGTTTFMVHYYENVGQAYVAVSMTKLDESGGGYGGGDTGGSGGSGGGYGGGSVVSVPIPPPANSTATVTTTALAMRAGPGAEFEQIKTLHGGEVVKLTGLYDGYWIHAHTSNNFAGWVNSQYLSYNAPMGDAQSNK